MVYKCLHDETCDSLKGYFVVNQHDLGTRNQNLLVKLPKIKLELGRQTFKYYGAKLYNELPINLRREENFLAFKRGLDRHVFN